MLKFPGHALPLATTSPFTPAGTHPPGDPGVWRRAWEDAAMATRPRVPSTPAGVPKGPGAPAGHPGCGDIGTPARTSATAALVKAAPAPAPEPRCETDGSALFSVPQAPVPSGHAADEADDRSPGAQRSRSGRSLPESTVRLHVERHGSDVAVWLGIDGDPRVASMRATAVLCELRRKLETTAQRLALVVCNGTPIYTAPPLDKETP